MSLKITKIMSFIKEKVLYVAGGISAAVVFFISILIKNNCNKTGVANINNRKRDFNKEQERIDKKADEAYQTMHNHLSSIPADELCDSFKESCDAILEGKKRVRERFDEYGKSLHSVRGGCHD